MDRQMRSGAAKRDKSPNNNMRLDYGVPQLKSGAAR